MRVRQTLPVIPARADDGSGAPLLAIGAGLTGLLAAGLGLFLLRRLNFKKGSRDSC